MSIRDPEAAGREIEARTVARVLEETAIAVGPVQVLVDPRLTVIRLVTGLASVGLAIRHDPAKDALVLVCAEGVKEATRT